jgi:phosphatidylglycerophosphate synthase
MTAGERWTGAQLERLSGARFAPAAWVRFLGDSFARSAETRRARPQLARQARAWSIVGISGGLAARTWARRARVPAPRLWSSGLWWLSVFAMLEWHIGMVEGPDGEQRERLTGADALTLLRLWSVPLLAAQCDPAQASGPAFTALIASAAASDALDGPLARQVGVTRLGRDLDKVADSLVVGVAARAASRAGWLPTGAARLAVVRSSLPVAYVAGSYFRTGRRPQLDSLGPGRLLAPALLGGLATAPFSSRAGAVLTGTASAASLALGLVGVPDRPR